MKIVKFSDFEYFNIKDEFKFIESDDKYCKTGPKTKNQYKINKTSYAQSLFKGVTEVGLKYIEGIFSLPIRLEIYSRKEDIRSRIKKNPYYQRHVRGSKFMSAEKYETNEKYLESFLSRMEKKKNLSFCYPEIQMGPKTKSQTKALKGYCTSGFRGVCKVGLNYLLNGHQMPANIEGNNISFEEIHSKKLTYKEIYENYFKTK